MKLAAIGPREASIFACITDTVVSPEPVLPPVASTDAVDSFDAWLVRSPRLNRVAFRALLHAVEVLPSGLGFGARMRRLPPSERARYLRALERARAPQLRQLVKALRSVALLSYYGDERVMLRLGYDAEANVRRGRELRVREGRP